MSDLLARISDARQAVEFVSAWTGISIGVLVAIAVVVYRDPVIWKVAVRAAIAIVLGYLLVMYGFRHGGATKQAEWDAANKRTAAEEKLRDKNAAQDASAAAAQQSAGLDSAKANDQEQANALRNADANCHPITRDQLR